MLCYNTEISMKLIVVTRISCYVMRWKIGLTSPRIAKNKQRNTVDTSDTYVLLMIKLFLKVIVLLVCD